MSQPHRNIDLSSSTSNSRPSLGQSSVISSPGSASQPLFNQKLIPRDFLGARSKLSPKSASEIHNSGTGGLFAANPFQNDREIQVKEVKGIQDNLRDNTVSPSSEAIPKSNARQDNDLNTSSPQPVKPLLSSTKARSASYGSPGSVDAEPFTSIVMPRTSSIDSAISNISTTSLSKATGDARELSPTSVRNLIATAGGAENLVTHLLKDKNNVASQNAQLWKLVEKQRSLIFGLNKDLERVTKERDRYKKRVKELEIHTINEDAETQPRSGPTPNRSPLPKANAGSLHRESPTPLQQEDMKATVPHGIASLSHGPRSSEDQNKENVPASDIFTPIVPDVTTKHPPNPIMVVPESQVKTPDSATLTFTINDASPSAEKSGRALPSYRKAAPKPLNLTPRETDGSFLSQIAATRDDADTNGEHERGRRRTREEDDRDREASALKAEAEAEARSRSKKNKTPKLATSEENLASAQTQVSAPLPTPGLPLSPRPQHAQTFVAPSVHLSPTGIPQTASLNERLFGAPLKSPGLPLSPRPVNRNDSAPLGLASLPLSPRANMGAFPLSPRAPKHALPAPTHLNAPVDAAALQNKQSRSYQSSPQASSAVPPDRLQVHQPLGSEPPPVYRGLAVSAYPNLLLPPNALPSIKVQVHSSRLRPSRYNAVNVKNQEETTVFSLSIISRSSNSELWRVEKVPAALPHLETQLKPRCVDLPKMPERRLFAGQSPVLVDERRVAIDTYFDELLDIHIDEQAAVTICKFLSTDVIDPEQVPKATVGLGMEPVTFAASSNGTPTKTGYLTKKGKNFGGWKSRFFILEGPDLRYYDNAGGPHLGTIRLPNALIGKQKESDAHEETDGQFRHAFRIQEPKRKDSGTYTSHILCAESDQERDEWVRALMYWVEAGNRSGSQELSDIDTRHVISKGSSSSKDTRDTHINTPTPTSGSSIDSSILDQAGTIKQTNISAPLNGGVIADNLAWGLKSPTSVAPRDPRDKTNIMSNIFGFKKPELAVAPQEHQPPKLRILRHNGYVRPVFGLPLAEAVEFCAPFNVDVYLPAVVYRCIEYLRYRNAASEEGLFRLSGSNVVVRNLKERFNTEGDVDLVSEDEYHDVHAVASLFKTYLRELPSTLLTRDLHIEFIKILELDNNADKIVAFNSLVHMLPPANFALLKEMSRYLLEVTENANRNKMTVRNVGIVFSPTLNIPTPVFTLFLTDFAAIFEKDSRGLPSTKLTEVRVPPSLTPDDIRSPRHQMFSDLPTPAYNQTSFHGMTAMAPPRGTMTGTGELGFMPIDQIYAASNQISGPRNPLPAQAAKPMTQVPDAGGYGSLNGMLAPASIGNADKAKKRESAIFSH